MLSFFRRLLAFCLILLLLGAVVFAMLPTLASTEWGRKQVVYWINRSIPGTIEIRSLDLHWTQGQDLEGILLKDPQGHSVFQIEKFSTEGTLWQLLRKSTHLGYTQIIDLNASIQTNEKGSTNLHNALGIVPAAITEPITPSTTLLSDVNVDLYLFSAHHPLSALIKGKTRQDKLTGSFEVNLALQALSASNWDQLKQDVQNYLSIEGSKEAKLQAHVVNFPVDLIDWLTSLFNPRLNGLFHSLLGDRLNLSIEKEPSQEGLAFTLTAQSPLMQGNLKGKVANGLVTLQEPGAFQFNLTPEFINPLSEERFRLLHSTLLKVNLQSLAFPLNILDSEATIDPCQFEFRTQVSLPKIDIDIPTVGPLSLVNLQGLINTPACDKNIDLQLSGKVLQGIEGFDFKADSTLSKPSQFSGLLEDMLENFQATVNINQFPLKLLPQFKSKPELLDLLGTPLDSQLKISSKGQNVWQAAFSLHTPKMDLKEASLQLDNELFLTKPAQLDLILSNHCFNTLLNKNDLTLTQPCPIAVVLKNFRVSLEDPSSGKFQLETSIPLIQFADPLAWGTLRIQNTVLLLEGQSLARAASSLTGQLSLLQPDGSLSPLLDEPLAFSLHSNLEVGKEGRMEIPLIRLEIKNSILNGEAEGKLSNFTTLDLTQSTQLNYLLTPAALDAVNQNISKEIPRLRENAALKLAIYPVSLDLKSLSLASLKLKGALAVDRLHFEDASGTHPLLEKIELPWEINGPENLIAADLKGMIYTPARGKPSPFTSHLQLWLTQGSFDPARTKAEIQMNFDGMPTSLLSSPFTPHDLSPILGPIIDLNLKTFLDPTQEKPGYVDLSLDSANFHVQGRFKLNHAASIYDENKIPNFRLNLTPESFEAIKKILAYSSELKLANPVTLSGQLSQFSLPLKEPILDQTLVDFAFSTTDIRWQNISSEPVKIQGKLSTQNLSESLQFSLKALSAAGTQAEVNFDGKLNDGIITLNKPLEGSVNLTPFITQTFLAPSVPLLSSAIGSENPVKFSISPNQFSCPLFPFQPDQIKVGKGMLDLGKIRFRNEGELSSVLNFIHSISDSTFTIWFTPLYFNLEKNILTLKRLDLLVANSYTLASWGSLNLNKQSADLVLGLSAQSLQYAFGIQGLDDQYILQIPLHSEKGKVEIDKKKATARITALIAQSQGGFKGKIIGNILDAALSNGGEIAPAPTTQPFPWKDSFKPAAAAGDSLKNQSESAAPSADPADGKKKKKKKSLQDQFEDPLKEIQEGAIQVLDSLFKGKQ